MKYLKLFENHQSEAEVAKICEEYGIKNWTLNSDGLVDVDGDIDLHKKGLTELPLKFGEVTGCFDCSHNKITSLEGAPHTVGRYFYFTHNKLTSLEFAPKLIDGAFSCENNNIRSFEGLVNIGGHFYCHGNPVWEIWSIINPGRVAFKWDSEIMYFFNDCSIIHDNGESIAIERFNFFLEEIGLDPVEEVKGYKNIY